MKLIGIGFGNLVAAERVISIVSPESAPIKRMIQEVRERGELIDASFGRSTRPCPDHGQRQCDPLGPDPGNFGSPLEERAMEEEAKRS